MISVDKNRALSIINSVLNEKGIKKKGDNWAFHCPKCKHRKRKLEVDIDNQTFHCWTCDFKGRKVRNLLLFVRADKNYISEIDSIYPSDYSYVNTDIEDDDKKEIVLLPREFRSLSEPTNSIEYKNAIFYVKNRGITAYDILKYNIGYCEDGDYKHRIVIPSYDEKGQLNYFSSRIYYDTGYSYMNSETSKNIIGFELFIDWEESIVLVEGVFDAIAIKRNTIPLFGKFLSKKLKSKIIEKNVRNIYIALDDDAMDSTIRISEDLLSEGRNVRVVSLEKHDPSVIGFNRMTEIMKETEELDFSGLMKLKMNL